MTTYGLIGAGHIGSTLAKLLVQAGHDVVISNSRGPETLSDLVSSLGPKARAATAAEAAADAEVAVVTIPLKNIAEVPAEPLVGKLVIDTNNYYPERDGQIAELDDETSTTAELLQHHLPLSKVVKAFNHIFSDDLATQGGRDGSRRALAVVGDDAEAVHQVGQLVDQLGFEPVEVTPLSEGWRVQRDTPAYTVDLDAEGLRQKMSEAKRYRDM
ncbi:NADPH-dependent F420 reductase [Angustibacter aerolatus]